MGSRTTNVLLNLLKHQRPNIDKIYSYVKDPFKSKYQLLINRREKTNIVTLKIEKHLLIYSQKIDAVYSLPNWKFGRL